MRNNHAKRHNLRTQGYKRTGWEFVRRCRVSAFSEALIIGGSVPTLTIGLRPLGLDVTGALPKT